VRAILPALLLLILSVPLGIALAQDDGETISLAEYRTRLDRIVLDLSQANTATTKRALGSAQEALDQIAQVNLPSGEVVEIEPLLSEQHTLDQALARLRLVQSQLAASGSDNTAARLEQLRRVLARPEFAPSLGERIENWLEELWRRIQPVANTPESRAATRTASSAIQWVLAGVGGVLVALLLSYWLQGFLRSFVADAEARRRLEAGEEMPLTASAARQQAAALAQGGNYRQAVRQLYLAALLQLEESGILRYDRSLTNREYVAQVAHVPPVQRRLRPVVDTFDAVWYGVREPDRATFDRYEQDVDGLTEAIPADRTTDGGAE
jgi:hypothetical protein